MQARISAVSNILKANLIEDAFIKLLSRNKTVQLRRKHVWRNHQSCENQHWCPGSHRQNRPSPNAKSEEGTNHEHGICFRKDTGWCSPVVWRV